MSRTDFFNSLLIDLSQQKANDSERQRLLDILDLSPDFIGIADLQGRLLYLNRAARRLVGLPETVTLENYHIGEVHPQWVTELLYEVGLPTAIKEGLWRGESALRHYDGYDIPVSQVVIAHKDERGNATTLSTIMRDISEQKLRESEVSAALAVAEQASAAKGQFLTSMSHELRTPLNGILGFAQLLDNDHAPASPERQKIFVDHILKAGKHLLTLINDILDLARIEAGKVNLSIEPVALDDILAECKALLEPSGSLRGIKLVFPEPQGLRVDADRTRLKQILLNILSNAIKYNRDSGTVLVSFGEMSDRRIRLSIQDTGAGLSPEQMGRLFQPFERLEQEAGAHEGTGIGLVVTKHLVEMMSGAIGASSSEGIGSIFWVELPITATGALDRAAPAIMAVRPIDRQAGLPTKRATLLYVEDNPANLRLVEEIIYMRGDLHLIAAPDGKLGIELTRAHLPDLVLMDLHLPGMNGKEARAVLQGDPRTAQIPIIALTANADPQEVARGLAAGFFRYITKPIDVGALNEAIDSALAAACRPSQPKE